MMSFTSECTLNPPWPAKLERRDGFPDVLLLVLLLMLLWESERERGVVLMKGIAAISCPIDKRIGVQVFNVYDEYRSPTHTEM